MAASFDSPPVETSSTRSSLPGARLGQQRREIDDRARQDGRIEVVELADVVARDRDDLGMAVAEDGAHLARGEVEDAPAVGIGEQLPSALSAISGAKSPP